MNNSLPHHQIGWSKSQVGHNFWNRR